MTSVETRTPVLSPFLNPAGIAVLGEVDEAALRRWGYTGGVIQGIDRSCDVALVATPAEGVVPALEACAEAGIGRAVALAGGFEGPAGAERRADLLAFLAATPAFRLIGPNCAGVLSAVTGTILSTSATRLDEPATVGGAGLVLQSGGIASGLLLTLLRRGAGFAHCVSTGDEFSVGGVEVAVALLDDPSCTSVGLFLEGLTDAHRLPDLAAAIARTGKPVVALRSGLSAGGRRAAFGHTSRVVGDGDIARAALEQAGVRLVATVDELSDVMTVLSVLPLRRGDHGPATVGVVTAAGGSGVLAADAMAKTPNLRLAPLSADATAAIESAVGSHMPVANPYDMPSLGDREIFRRALRAMGEHGGCAVLVAVITTLAHDYERIAGDDYSGLPPIVIAHLSTDERFTPDQARRLAAAGIPNVPSVQHAIAALAAWAGRSAVATPADARPDETAGHRRLGLIRSRSVLGAALDRWLAPARPVTSVAEALDQPRPVVVKAEGSNVEHRTERGAVRTGLQTDAEVAAAYEAVRAHGDGVVVQAMAAPGIEVLVSVVRDPEVGPVAVVRPGGVLVELTGTTTILTGPPATWPGTLAPSAVGRLLAGYRGSPPSDTAALLDLVAALVAAVDADDRIAGVECNPVIVHERSATVVDVATYLS